MYAVIPHPSYLKKRDRCFKILKRIFSPALHANPISDILGYCCTAVPSDVGKYMMERLILRLPQRETPVGDVEYKICQTPIIKSAVLCDLHRCV